MATHREIAGRTSKATPRDGGLLAEGVASGVLGATVLALWFLIIDWIRGEPLATPSVLGSLLFRGEAARGVIDGGAVAGYSVVHFVAFVAVGIAAAAVARRIEERPRVILAVVILFAAIQAFTLAFTTVLAEALEGTIRWWAAVLGNFLAVGAMVAYLWLRHRRVSRTLDDRTVFGPREG